MAINRQSQPLLRDRPTAAVMLPMKRGLLVRVGKDQHARALARPDAKPTLVVVGSWLGNGVIRKLDPQRFSWLVGGLILLSGVGLLVK